MIQYCGSLRDREVESLASDRQGFSFESCVWRAVSSHSSHHPQVVLLAQFSLYVHKGGLKPHSFHFGPLNLKPHSNRMSRDFYLVIKCLGISSPCQYLTRYI